MKYITNKSPFLFAFFMLIAIGLLMTLPIKNLLNDIGFSDFQTEYVNLFIKMGALFIISYSLIHKLNITSIAGISSVYRWRYKYLNIIPIYLIAIGLLSALSKDLSQIELSNIGVLLIGCLAAGFGEEFMFRGLLQPLFIKKFINQKRGLFLGVFIPALFFGLFHLINLITSEQVLPVLIQVVFATFIGFFFGVLVLKTNKLIPLAITHGLINFFFSLQSLPNITDTTNDSSGGIGAEIAPLILFFPLFIIGLFVIKKISNESIQEKLQTSINL